MTNNKKHYHLANVIVIPTMVLSGILLARMGQMADAQQISMSAPGMMVLSTLLFVILGVGVIWVAISTLLNKNIQAAFNKVNLKRFITIAGLLIVMIAFSILIFPMGIVFAALALYLFFNSCQALATKRFASISHQ